MATSKTLTATNVTMSIPEMTDPPVASVYSTDVGALGDAANSNTEQVNALGSSIAKISDGDTHAALAAGDFVYIKNHGTLATGLYTANEAIQANGSLTSSNMTTVSDGGLNQLSSNISGKANGTATSVANGSSETFTNVVPCFVSAGRGNLSSHTTTAFIDGWGNIIYLDQNANITLSTSGNNVTITNNIGAYCSCIIVY